MRPQLVAPWFGDEVFARLARVLAHTAAVHCPHWQAAVTQIVPQAPHATHRGASPSHIANTQKLDAWCQAVQAAPDGTPLLLIDVDTFIANPLDAVWDIPFDFAYTTKAVKYPHNAGVIFVRASDRSRTFLQVWADENRRMLRDQPHHQPWRRKYGGINQASLGYVLESGRARDIQIHRLPCAEWNCEDSAWREFNPHVTKIVHVKSLLRLRLFFPGGSAPLPYLRPLIALWRRLEHEALGQELPV